jgi:hypothetical protein
MYSRTVRPCFGNPTFGCARLFQQDDISVLIDRLSREFTRTASSTVIQPT